MYKLMKVFEWWKLPENIRDLIKSKYDYLENCITLSPFVTANWKNYADEKPQGKVAIAVGNQYVLQGDDILSEYLMAQGVDFEEDALVIVD